MMRREFELRKQRMLFGAYVVAPFLLFLPSTLHAAKWTTVSRSAGTHVMKRDVPGRNFPTFRAVATVNASVYDVLAVLSDVDRYTRWMDRCSEARRLEQRGELEYVSYARTDAPWPVSDRDAVYHAKVRAELAEHRIVVRFRAIKSKRVPPKKGVVRLSKLRGHYALTILGPNKTRLDYQVDADPGGWIPAWIGRITARVAIVKTINGLRNRVKATRGWYAKRIARWKELAQSLEQVKAVSY